MSNSNVVKAHNVSIRMSEKTKSELKALADEEMRTESQMARILIMEGLKNRTNQNHQPIAS